MVAASNDPYTVAIESITEFEDVHQRAQVQHGTRVYDISWDSANERVVAYYTEQNQPWWFEIRCDGAAPQDITLGDVLMAFGCVSEDTVPVLGFPLDHGFTIGNYLVTPISAEFLMQMDVLSADEYDQLPLADQDIPIEDDDDPTPTSSDNDSIEEDDSDNPSIQG